MCDNENAYTDENIMRRHEVCQNALMAGVGASLPLNITMNVAAMHGMCPQFLREDAEEYKSHEKITYHVFASDTIEQIFKASLQNGRGDILGDEDRIIKVDDMFHMLDKAVAVTR